MALPQFPNVFYGSASYQGAPAASGMIVTAVTGQGTLQERHFTLEVRPKGRFGSGNGLKLKVGGSGDDLADRERVSFYVSPGPLENNSTLDEAGHSHFYADSMPHITRVTLCQD